MTKNIDAIVITDFNGIDHVPSTGGRTGRHHDPAHFNESTKDSEVKTAKIGFRILYWL